MMTDIIRNSQQWRRQMKSPEQVLARVRNEGTKGPKSSNQTREYSFQHCEKQEQRNNTLDKTKAGRIKMCIN